MGGRGGEKAVTSLLLRRACNGPGCLNHAHVKRGQRWVRSFVWGEGVACQPSKAAAGSPPLAHIPRLQRAHGSLE